jgi:S-formylglutathione hydrolase FrmB
MSVGEMHLFSSSLLRQATFAFYVPSAQFEPPYPALLQLHGAGDNYASWFQNSMLPVHLERYPFVVVTPAGDLSSWTNFGIKGRGTAYEDYLVQDLMPEVERIFPIRPGPWAIGGLSMGGYGAVRLGLLYPDRFASIYAHSSALFRAERWRERRPDITDEDLAAADIFPYAARVAGEPDRPALTFDCGEDDPLLPDNRAFHAYLEEIGYPHTYHEYPGGHTWDYWNAHVQDALARHAEVLGVTPLSPAGSSG